MSKVTVRLGAGIAGPAEGSREGLTSEEAGPEAAASAGGLSPEGADSQRGGGQSQQVLTFPGRAATQGRAEGQC